MLEEREKKDKHWVTAYETAAWLYPRSSSNLRFPHCYTVALHKHTTFRNVKSTQKNKCFSLYFRKKKA